MMGLCSADGASLDRCLHEYNLPMSSWLLNLLLSRQCKQFCLKYCLEPVAGDLSLSQVEPTS